MSDRQRRLVAFDRIFVPHPRMQDIERQIGNLIKDTRARIKGNEERRKAAKGRPVKDDELWALPIVGPTRATKSKSIQKVVETIYSNPDLPDDDIPVLTVTVKSSSRSPRQLQAQILEAYGDPSAEIVRRSRNDYSEAEVNADISKIARRRNTSVIVLDEAHSMLVNGGEGLAKIMATTIKSIVNDAVFSVVIAGTDEVRPLLRALSELQSRLKVTIDLGAFDSGRKEDREYFFGFSGLLEEEMLKDKVISKPIGLIDSVENRAMLFDFTGGVIGTVGTVLRLALERVLDEGRTAIKWSDIERAFQGWNASQEDAGYDPFGKGVRRTTLLHCEKDRQ